MLSLIEGAIHKCTFRPSTCAARFIFTSELLYRGNWGVLEHRATSIGGARSFEYQWITRGDYSSVMSGRSNHRFEPPLIDW